jgi:TolB protein
VSAFCWSPDDQHLAFVVYKDGASNIYKVAATGGAILHVVSDSLSIIGIEWSPDGGRLVYFQHNSGSKELKCCNVAASGGEPALSKMDFNFEHPSPGVYSPDGSELAAWKDHEIWVIPAEEF